MVELHGNQGFILPRHNNQFKPRGEHANGTAPANDHGALVHRTTGDTAAPVEPGKSAQPAVQSTVRSGRRAITNVEGFAALHLMFKHIVAILAQSLQLGPLLLKMGISKPEEPEGVAVPGGIKAAAAFLVVAPPTLFVAKANHDDENDVGENDGEADNAGDEDGNDDGDEDGDEDEASDEDDASLTSPATGASAPTEAGDGSDMPLSRKDIDLDILV